MFHFTKAMLQRVFSLGLKNEYHNKAEFSNWFGEVVALKMLPPEYALRSWNRSLRNGPPIRSEGLSSAIEAFCEYVQVRKHFKL